MMQTKDTAAREEKSGRKKWLPFLLVGLALVLVAAIVLLFVFGPFSTKKTGTTPEESKVTQGDDTERTDPTGGGDTEPSGTEATGDDGGTPGGDDNDPDPGPGPGGDDGGDDGGDPAGPADTTKPAGTTTTVKPGETTTTTANPGNPGSSIPDVTQSTANYLNKNGYNDYIVEKLLDRKYEEYRFFKTLPSDFASVSKNARTLLREELFVKSDTYYQPMDYQREVSQRGKYVFQNMASQSNDPTKQYFVKYEGNPILWGQNLYTPWIVKSGDTWYVYYGGYGDEQTGGMDTTFLATTKDPEMRSGWTLHGPVVTPAGPYLCAQDPAVDIRNGKWVMVYSYTRMIQGQGIDWIGVSTSDDGIHWTPDLPEDESHEITITNHNRGDLDILGRPSLYYNESKDRWEMYADGILSGDSQKGMYLLYSTEAVPMNWTLEGQIMTGAGESCLAVLDGTYYMGYRPTAGNWPTRMAIAKSEDGIHFTDSTLTMVGEELSNGQVNNVSMMAFAVDGNRISAILYGRSLEGWSHKVSIAYPQKLAEAWRGGEKIDGDPTATSSTTQIYDSKGSTAPVSYFRILPEYGQPAEFDTTVKLHPNMAYFHGELTQKPAKPVLIAPYNNSAKQHWGPQFSWRPAAGAQGYKLMVAEDAAFAVNAFYINTLFTEEYKPVNSLKHGKTYYWKVIASNARGSTESDVYKFTVVGENELIGEYLSLYPTNITGSEDATVDSNINNLSDGPYWTNWTAFYEEDDLPSFTIDYGKAFPVTRFYMTPRPDYVGVPLEFKLEYSLDGKNYRTILPEEYEMSEAQSGGVTTNYATLKAPVEARFVRYTITATIGSMGGLCEFRAQVLR